VGALKTNLGSDALDGETNEASDFPLRWISFMKCSAALDGAAVAAAGEARGSD